MKLFNSIIILIVFFFSCNQNVKELTKCELNDLEQQDLVRSCKLCHNNSGGLDLGHIKASSYSHLYEIGKEKLVSKIDSLKQIKDEYHQSLDTLSPYEIECIVGYIGRYSDVQR